MNTILSIRGLQASYGRAQVLFDISMDVHPGEVITLLGRNGMGRSTIVKCLFGMLPLGAGSITSANVPIGGWPSHRIAHKGLALVPEGRQIFPTLTVEENLIATARCKPNAKSPWTLERIYDLFPSLRIRRENLGTELSGGEQQMLAIGRALMTNPSLLVLDEATEGLAPLIRAEIWRVLTSLKSEGLSLVVIDKNIKALLELADRHYVIEKGLVVWKGSSAEILESPNLIHQYLGV